MAHRHWFRPLLDFPGFLCFLHSLPPIFRSLPSHETFLAVPHRQLSFAKAQKSVRQLGLLHVSEVVGFDCFAYAADLESVLASTYGEGQL